ncbi:anhydro-N-acetylmuramic acid kinase [Polaribacter sp. R2A056_3_33]|uniref:anhydro-N-acetylmuramic acid kinase n=1 Tax=Polaribacter sp. R2A056_3_33 TaxID=2745563 RepID=UPI001C4F603C|nr:anhydro-N-acetylmuramic acid kinase [Polaribacter sp. R2A056_3_33]QXP69062.1 anhydro-N-acetylmuramic acid kinase [Polaribacter sp. R2A056_3_33]
MNIGEVFIIGLMSGTSLDGIDLVYVKFDKNKYQDFSILYSKTVSYSEKWKATLQDAIHFSSDDLNILDVDYGKLLGKEITAFVDEFQIEKIDFIASHGHTVLHQPENGITLQVGDGQTIADATGQKVICDFRTQDVNLGGQGAPLVPIGDELLFSDYDYCLNLGGFSNISFHENGKRIAYDVCPVNIVLNKYAKELGFEYDDKGQIAANGTYLMQLESDLRLLEYYQQKPPKSLGLEWVQKEIFPRLESVKRKPEDLLRTFTDHVAWALAEVLPKNARVLVTGGGAFNEYLINKVREEKEIDLIVPDQQLINFKEALIFAFLGLLKSENKVNCLSSVTGASKDHSSGEVFYPKL